MREKHLKLKQVKIYLLRKVIRQTAVMKHIVLALLVLVCSLPAYIFRKQIRYLYCPEEIIEYYIKKRIFLVFNFSPSFSLAIIAIINSRIYLHSNLKLAPYENISLLIGLIGLLVLLFITGYITDKILYWINLEYKIWRDIGIITKVDDPSSNDMSM